MGENRKRKFGKDWFYLWESERTKKKAEKRKREIEKTGSKVKITKGKEWNERMKHKYSIWGHV